MENYYIEGEEIKNGKEQELGNYYIEGEEEKELLGREPTLTKKLSTTTNF